MMIRQWHGDQLSIKVKYDKCGDHGEHTGNCPADVYGLENNKAGHVTKNACVERCTSVSVCSDKFIEYSSSV